MTREFTKEAKKAALQQIYRELIKKIETSWNTIQEESGNVHSVEQVHAYFCMIKKIKGSEKCGQCLQ